MEQEELKNVIWKIAFAVFICALLVSSIIYLNKRWKEIRDIRREADARSIEKALDFYSIQFGGYPENSDDDGDGWDKSNDPEQRTFLEPMAKVGLLPGLVFDPKNDENYYYRYQKFASGDFGCRRPFAVFQIVSYETENKNIGQGSCPDINWTTLAPNGYTWFSLD